MLSANLLKTSISFVSGLKPVLGAENMPFSYIFRRWTTFSLGIEGCMVAVQFRGGLKAGQKLATEIGPSQDPANPLWFPGGP